MLRRAERNQQGARAKRTRAVGTLLCPGPAVDNCHGKDIAMDNCWQNLKNYHGGTHPLVYGQDTTRPATPPPITRACEARSVDLKLRTGAK